MKIRTSLAAGAVLALAFAATPVNAVTGTVTQTWTVIGIVTGKHHLESQETLPDSVNFLSKYTQVTTCDGGFLYAVRTITYDGALIEGENGVYVHLAQYWIGMAAASAEDYSGAPTRVEFNVAGQNALDLHHAFDGEGVGVGSHGADVDCDGRGTGGGGARFFAFPKLLQRPGPEHSLEAGKDEPALTHDLGRDFIA